MRKGTISVPGSAFGYLSRPRWHTNPAPIDRSHRSPPNVADWPCHHCARRISNGFVYRRAPMRRVHPQRCPGGRQHHRREWPAGGPTRETGNMGRDSRAEFSVCLGL